MSSSRSKVSDDMESGSLQSWWQPSRRRVRKLVKSPIHRGSAEMSEPLRSKAVNAVSDLKAWCGWHPRAISVRSEVRAEIHTGRSLCSSLGVDRLSARNPVNCRTESSFSPNSKKLALPKQSACSPVWCPTQSASARLEFALTATFSTLSRGQFTMSRGTSASRVKAEPRSYSES
eukprot:2900353-Rhodomonas_salina.1